jgi:hypothetical protein
MIDPFRLALREAASGAALEECARRVAAIAAEHGKTIVPWLDLRPAWNCFAFALGLSDSDVHDQVSRRTKPSVFADSCFVKVLMHRPILRRADLPAAEGSLALYFPKSDDYFQSFPMHAGIVTNSRILSKWGDGPVLEHDALDVPDTYGDGVWYYRKPSLDTIESAFVEYAEFLAKPGIARPPGPGARNERP